jgi:D-alanyl-D-alanine carboxypeptidase
MFAIIATLAMAAAIVPATANPKYAAYVLDANTGKVLFSRIPVSRNAAAEQPSKIGLRAGSSITVENAILALVTKSANDVATALGEHIGGSEARFGQMMTAKARQLGMNATQFRNAHGLPNTGQYTTAHDMAILGVALREHFPHHYHYFSTRSFSLGKARYGNHNRLLGRVRGVDGIKTGYIRASGFNLVSSVQDNGRSIVAVVMGGRTGRSRDAHMTALIREHLPRASRRDGGPLVAAAQPAPGAFALPKADIPTPSFRPAGEIAIAAYAPVTAAAAPVRPSVPVAAPIPSAPVPEASIASRFDGAVDPVTTASTSRSGWVVQVASSPSQNDAFSALVRTGKEASSVLASANAFIEEFNNKGTIYYRARFGGFDSKNQAWQACDALKRQKIDCYAVQL